MSKRDDLKVEAVFMVAWGLRFLGSALIFGLLFGAPRWAALTIAFFMAEFYDKESRRA